jgi:hypothetical protein
MFSDAIMGGPFTEPEQQQQSIYEIEYYIFEKLFFQN